MPSRCDKESAGMVSSVMFHSVKSQLYEKERQLNELNKKVKELEKHKTSLEYSKAEALWVAFPHTFFPRRGLRIIKNWINSYIIGFVQTSVISLDRIRVIFATGEPTSTGMVVMGGKYNDRKLFYPNVSLLILSIKSHWETLSQFLFVRDFSQSCLS